MATAQGSKVYVGNLNWGTDDTGLRNAFEQFGAITQCIVMRDKETGRSRGFGFVTYDLSMDAETAVREMNEKELDGRYIKVNLARPREDRRGGGGQWR